MFYSLNLSSFLRKVSKYYYFRCTNLDQLKKPLSLLILLSVFCFNVRGQSGPSAELYGKVDTADLKMTSCDFEPDANAEILFDRGVFGSQDGFSAIERHTRIKIFNDFGKNKANIKLIYYVNPKSYFADGIAGLEAETINLVEGRIKVIPVDKTQIFTQTLGNGFSAVMFTFPEVRAGSIVEWRYKTLRPSVWFFQSDIPTRYSEVELDRIEHQYLRFVSYVTQPYVKDTGAGTEDIQVKALQNVHSAPQESYMGPLRDRLQRIEFYSSKLKDNSWQQIIGDLLNIHRFSNELSGGVAGEDNIIGLAKKLKTKDQQIAFLFDTVRNHMKWNGVTSFTSERGKSAAWNTGSGNSAEINLILYHLLKKTGLIAFPLMVGTPDNDKIDLENPDRFAINGVVTYVPVDSVKYYVLDASNKFGLFNTISSLYLNSYGIILDADHQSFNFVMLKEAESATKTMFVDANMSPDGKITGYAEINSSSYNKLRSSWAYKSRGAEKFIDSLQKTSDNLKISSLKIENTTCDTLPLTQKINFSIDLPASGDNYLYLNTNLFCLAGKNPFINEERFSDIDFEHLNNLSVSSTYHIAEQYKIESLPKPTTVVMPDQSIVFRRFVAQQNGVILVRYAITHKSVRYPLKDYPDLRGFYKKIYELLNEPIVLKRI